jgi:pimeloyl-ACP methyl ester carboxylesterase
MTRRAYVDGPFGQMHARMAGSLSGPAPVLACFHMSPMSSHTYDRFAERLAASGRGVVALDTPGFGMSDAPPEAPAIADYARASLAAIDALGIEGPVDLMGYHTGSMIACEIAATHPQRVRRLVLVAAPIFTDEERAAMIAHYTEEPVTADGAHLLKIWRGFHHHFSIAGAPLAQIANAFPERLLGRDTAWWGHAAAFGFAPDMRLPEIAQAVLVLQPGDDLEAETRRAAPLLRHGRIAELPNWGHGFLDLHTDAAARLVESFLDAPDSDPFAALQFP